MLVNELIPAANGERRRLMLVLHGLGDSVDGYRWLPEALGLPGMNYLLVNAPDPYFGGFSWYDFGGDPDAGVNRSRQSLFVLLDSLRAGDFPTEQTVVFGFSQGCLLTWEIGLRYPHRFAGLIGVSGYAHQPEKLIQELSPVAKEQRFLVTHGTQDPLIPIGPAREQVVKLMAAGIRVDWREFAKAHTLAGAGELDVIRHFIQASF